ncbi:MAG: DUF899 domain-containing protein [bacterium]|nr:DUF899 domain-containing protein [bacterium]
MSAVSTTDIAGAKPPDDPIPHPRSGRQTTRINIENRQAEGLHPKFRKARPGRPPQLDAIGQGQYPGLSVFEKDLSGEIRHFYSQSADLGPDGFRGMDLLNPLWHLVDCLPEGHGDFFPAMSYA